MIVHAHGGLANRLRVILSYRARSEGGVQVIWHPDSQVANGRFTDCFESLDDVTFLDHGEAQVSTCDPCPDAPANWQASYRDLVLRPKLEAEVNYLASPIAIHVRRTDIVDLGLPLEPLEKYRSFVRDFNPDWRTFLAADCHDTQAWFHEQCDNVIYQDIPPHDPLAHDHRATSLEQAAVDMFTCARADYFMGTSASAFTWAIEILRRLR